MDQLKSILDFEYRNIIVRMPNWIGDMVMATPILTDLRKAYPNSRITAMCRSPVCDLLKRDPEIDALLCFSKTSGFSRRSEKKSIVGRFREEKYDLGILLTHSLSSTWQFWRGNVKTRLGYNCNGRRFFLSSSVPLPKGVEKQHLVVTYKGLLKLLGIPISTTNPRLFLSDKEVADAKTLLLQHGVTRKTTLIGINPSATYGLAKCWLPERFRAVAKKLLKNPKDHLLFFGDRQTAPLVKQICGGLGPRVINLAGLTSLRELTALISLCDVLLTNDSGPMHIADALGIKIVALFGSTNEIATGPYQSQKVIHKHVECSPCYLRTCPIDFRCMKEIGVNEVCEAILSKLKTAKSKLHIIA
jgi:heptosyltransferase-2